MPCWPGRSGSPPRSVDPPPSPAIHNTAVAWPQSGCLVPLCPARRLCCCCPSLLCSGGVPVRLGILSSQLSANTALRDRPDIFAELRSAAACQSPATTLSGNQRAARLSTALSAWLSTCLSTRLSPGPTGSARATGDAHSLVPLCGPTGLWSAKRAAEIRHLRQRHRGLIPIWFARARHAAGPQRSARPGWPSPIRVVASARRHRTGLGRHLIATGAFAHHPNDQYGENLDGITGGTASLQDVISAWAGEASS